MYWDKKFPKLLTCDDLAQMRKAGASRLLCVQDVTCDPFGSIEFNKKICTIDSPFYVYEAETDTIHDSYVKCVLFNCVLESRHVFATMTCF